MCGRLSYAATPEQDSVHVIVNLNERRGHVALTTPDITSALYTVIHIVINLSAYVKIGLTHLSDFLCQIGPDVLSFQVVQ